MHEETWGIPIAVDLFFTGVGGGSFILSAMASRRNGEGWETCSQGAALLAPLAIFVGLSMLILDLGYPSRFWMTLRTFNPHSPMSIGSWLLSLFVVVALLYALYWLPAPIRARIPWVSTLTIWKKVRWRDRLGMIGMVLAVGVCVYTGVLLSATVSPLWRSLSLAVLFLLSAITTGFAGGGMVMLCLSKRMNLDILTGPFQFIRRSYRIVLPFYFLVALGFSLWPTPVPDPSPVFNTLMMGWSGLVWWFGVMGVGWIVPYFLVLKARAISIQTWVLFGCLLIGGFLLRLVLVLGGQGGSPSL